MAYDLKMRPFDSLYYIITHVFLPWDLPEESDYTLEDDLSLLGAVCAAAHAYTTRVQQPDAPSALGPQWLRITRMLDNLHASSGHEHLNKDCITSQLHGMVAGDILVFFVRSHNAAVIITKQDNHTLFESCGVSPPANAVEETGGPLIYSYPQAGSAVEVPNEILEDTGFQSELASFLSGLHAVHPYSSPKGSSHPQYLTLLLIGILRGVGCPANDKCITKRLRDDVIWGSRHRECGSQRFPSDPWRRSSLWFLVKAAVQMSFDRSPVGRGFYKQFMLFFMCTIPRVGDKATLSSDSLQLIACKILRRLGKLGSTAPNWLSEMAVQTCACLREILDTTQKQEDLRTSPFQNPSQDELSRDSEFTFLNSHDYMHDALANHNYEPDSYSFQPNYHHRSTLAHFLSTTGVWFLGDIAQEGNNRELYDVEQAVEEEIDSWLSNVTNVTEACAQVEMLMDKYLWAARASFNCERNQWPGDYSVALLTGIELFVALDKLVVQEIPMLADYCPEIPVTLLETLLLRKSTTLHRLSCAYQYLSARHSQSSPGWSVLSNKFTENSFPVRYYDQSSHLHQLKTHMEGDVASLPDLSILAKVVVFEFHCPPCLRIWRSAVARVLYYFDAVTAHPGSVLGQELDNEKPLGNTADLQPYFIAHDGPFLHIQIFFANPQSLQPWACPTLGYILRCDGLGPKSLTVWQSERTEEVLRSIVAPRFWGQLQHDCFSWNVLGHYWRTSNEVFAAQMHCPTEFSLDEFTACAHLQSSGSLQWLNILQGLRSGTLNVRRHEVYCLLARAVSQVGPLDLNTGFWTWHQELQDPLFCHSLLDELGKLFAEVTTSSIDGKPMRTISLLLTRILASSPCEDISNRTIQLLRKVRSKTFIWVEELSYNLAKAPINDERHDLLLDMALTCQSTFSVDTVNLPQILYSAEDVDSLLSSLLFIYALSADMDRGTRYPRPILEQHYRLSFAVEVDLRDAIISDPSEYGIDLAIGKIFARYRPSLHRWEHDSCRITCQTGATANQASKMVYLDLSNGELRVDGQQLIGLLCKLSGRWRNWDGEVLRRIFREQGLMVIPSELPGMDFTTHTVAPDYKVHFSLWNGDLVVRAQCSRTRNIFHLIPSSAMDGNLPPALVNAHVHWLNLSTKTIEIRPLERLWEQSSENWQIDCTDCTSGRYRVFKGRETLVNTHSQTWEMISKCFARLNGSPPLVTTSQLDGLQLASGPQLHLSVTLPLYGLLFFVNTQGELESYDFKDMIYDENQCIGTLSGLDSFLVLRSKACCGATLVPKKIISRRILVPNGFPREESSGWGGDRQIRISINPPDIFCHVYDVDTELGCLACNGNILSMEYLARLYALTSCIWPDKLTGKTGPQTALCLLQSARRASMTLRAPDDDHSKQGPIRYPQIKAAYRDYHPSSVWDMKALKRAMQRASHLFPSDTGRPNILDGSDDTIDYCHLVCESDLELQDVIATTASVVYRWSTDAPTTDVITTWTELWVGNNTGMDHDDAPSYIPPTLDGFSTKVHNIIEKGEGISLSFQLLFHLLTAAYSNPGIPSSEAAFLSMLAAFACKSGHHSGDPSIHDDYNFAHGYRPTKEAISRYIFASRIEVASCESFVNLDLRLEDLGLNSDVVDKIEESLKKWPSNTAPPSISLDPSWFDVTILAKNLRELFASCHRNFSLKERLVCLLTEPRSCTLLLQDLWSQKPLLNDHTPWQVTLDQLLCNRRAPKLPPCITLSFHNYESDKIEPDAIPPLHQLFSSLSPEAPFQEEYITQLNKSARYCRESGGRAHRVLEGDFLEALTVHYEQCSENYLSALAMIKATLNPTNSLERTLEQFCQWPVIRADSLLQCLASTSQVDVPPDWKTCMITLALLLLDLQRSQRLLRFALDGLDQDFSKELENKPCEGWKPEEYPDWLLIQIQGNFLIRRTQAETAMEMISPGSGQNTTMQVDMGEGKSSVIIPIVAAALADGKQLVRVIVPKALTVQMFNILTARLCGLANRPIYYLPFSRNSDGEDSGTWSGWNQIKTDNLHKLLSKWMEERGILLAWPEHVMSLKLKSIEEQVSNLKERLVTEKPPKLWSMIYKRVVTCLSAQPQSELGLVGRMFGLLSQLALANPSNKIALDNTYHDHDGSVRDSDPSQRLSLQKWIDSHARDILDESDEILRPRFQLIYTFGLQQHLDGYPDRWTISQHVLKLVKECAFTLSRNHPNSIQYEGGPPASFPYIYIVRASDGGRHLVSSIVDDILDGRLPGFNFDFLSPALCDAIRSFISDENVLELPDTVKMVEDYARGSNQTHLWNGLLLLRGLLALNNLVFALSQWRWRVNYGPTGVAPAPRATPATMLAVPFRAKDVPVPNTQFSHPDITILLTCLSYYYAGLDEKQLRASFEILLDEDDPSTEFTHWIEDYGSDQLPNSIRALSEINLMPSEQWDKVIFPLFTRNCAAIDFYLSRVVFPKEAKEYPWKISASGWDLAEKRERLITGFSGTNDNRWLLPMSMVQCDLDHQRGTSARVLGLLLLPENDCYMVTQGSGSQLSTRELLRMVAAQSPKIEVLMDAGAQILDLSNREVAKAWLDIVEDAAASVYFNENDELMVITRSGATLPMQSSPFAQHLGRCVVYLDHAHTRGTDLKFPNGSRAAVTLGPKLTKDSLVQSCMRMRKLGQVPGHSVMFFAPPDVDSRIRTVANKDPKARVETVDVLRWSIHETWADIQQRAPYWAQQGMDHKSRHTAWSRFCNNDLTREELLDAWLRPERNSLVDLYAPSETRNKARGSLSDLDSAILRRCKYLGIRSLPNAKIQEEHEREVNREQERERQVEWPPGVAPAQHILRPDVIKFVKTGILPLLDTGSAFVPVFSTLGNSSAVTREGNVWSPYILATADFCKTVEPDSGTVDQYLRPVQWILSRRTNQQQPEVLVLLSPFEADRLLPDIRESEHVHLHLYAPRTSRRARPCDDLQLYTIPPLPSDWTPPWHLIDQLNVFAGQLYLRDYQSYLRLCRFLGVPTKESPKDGQPRWNLFSIPGSWDESEIKFLDSPLPFVAALLAIRSRERPFAHTHMGKILQGQLLEEKDFEAPRASGSMMSDVECDVEMGQSAPNLGRKRELEGFADMSAKKAPACRLRYTKI